jgi:hypothetical protein
MIRTACFFLSSLALSLGAFACAADGDVGEDMNSTHDEIRVSKSFVAKGTGYYPANNAMEGGFSDRKGVKLKTLQQFLDGKADFVSVAMDTSAFSYGQRLRINELNAKYKKEIVFRVVDTGGAFKGKGTSRIDICTANAKASTDPTVNGSLHIDVIDEKGGPPETKPDPTTPSTGSTSKPAPSTNPPSTITPTPKPRPQPTADDTSPDPVSPDPVIAEPDPVPSSGSGGGGSECISDGACNPGNDGSGLMCSGGRCVPGCHTNAQCPGVKTCQSGQCR